MPRLVKKLPRWPLVTCVLLLQACASNSPQHVPVAVQAAQVPPLPIQARQPKPPPICSPTCSDGLTKLYKELQDSLTRLTAPASPASGPGR